MAKATCKNCLHDGVCFMQEVCEDLEEQLAVFGCKDFAETAPVVHGRWEPRTDVIGFVRCSVCHDCNIYDDWPDGKKWNYCPNCGAKMDGENDA